MKKVTAITLTCNRLGTTKKWLSELKDKNNYPFNHIIVDNGSTDGTLEWLKSQGYETLSISENIGQARALRIAWMYVKKKYNPDYYIRFDDDCEVLTENVIEKMIKFFSQCDSYIAAPINISLEKNTKYMPQIFAKAKEKGHEIWNVSHVGGLLQMMPKKAINLLLKTDDFQGDLQRCKYLISKGIDPVYLYDLKIEHKGEQTKEYKL